MQQMVDVMPFMAKAKEFSGMLTIENPPNFLVSVF